EGRGLMPDGTSRLSYRGRMLHHYMGTSTFAEYTIVPEIALAKIRRDAPLEKVCLLGCGITTGIGAVLNTAKVHPGATVAVFGLGGIGLSVVQGCVMAGAGRIIGIDTNPEKFAMARRLGATDVLDPATVPGLAGAVVEITRGGVDFSFE